MMVGLPPTAAHFGAPFGEEFATKVTHAGDPDEQSLSATSPRSALRVAIFNVKFSPNLGDGVISECLEHALQRCSLGLKAQAIDLAGRTGFSQQSGRRRGTILGLLELATPAVRKRLVPLAISVVVRLRLKRKWAALLKGCDVAVIGGGALIADADQNFPIKLSTALALCAERGIPVAIGHVGVSSHWSVPGHERLARALKRARIVSLTFRDPASVEAWSDLFAAEHLPSPEVALDPGLLARETFGDNPVARLSRRRSIGLCMTSPIVLRLHGDGAHDSRYTRDWFDAVIRRLVDENYEVVLFTNGSPEDEAFKDAAYAWLEDKTGVSLAERPTRPSELAHLISGFDAVLAHRLHACIVSYSYGVPAIGMSWDKKLLRFFQLVGRDRFMLDTGSCSPAESVALIHAAIREESDEFLQQRVTAECRSDIARLVERIERTRLAP